MDEDAEEEREELEALRRRLAVLEAKQAERAAKANPPWEEVKHARSSPKPPRGPAELEARPAAANSRASDEQPREAKQRKPKARASGEAAEVEVKLKLDSAQAPASDDSLCDMISRRFVHVSTSC